jgi:colicin import membrane protein
MAQGLSASARAAKRGAAVAKARRARSLRLTWRAAQGISRCASMREARWRAGAVFTMGAALVAASAPGRARAQTADDHGVAAALVAQLEHDAAHAAVTAEAVSQAKGALERATRLRTAGDETHAKAADGLALEWAQVGRDLAKAADAEASAADARKKAVEAQALLERTRAQVEEGIAHVGRLQAELGEAEKGPRVERVAVEVHEGDKGPAKKGGGAGRHGPAAHPKGGADRGDKPSKTGGAP